MELLVLKTQLLRAMVNVHVRPTLKKRMAHAFKRIARQMKFVSMVYVFPIRPARLVRNVLMASAKTTVAKKAKIQWIQHLEKLPLWAPMEIPLPIVVR
ncbi:hypothetical protein [Verminephrobacter aporrectodeae]|uniref:hypothetical protein n=1 Tax=Verminephrobacter aporrectodeae TaxID=1110389 RepID=UPI00223821B7|nr:hypothetical protein [Verminephrobacter aporrectodeae]